MPAFLTSLDMRQIAEAHESPNGRPLFKIMAPLKYESDVLGWTVVVPAGFTTDLASVPRIPLAWWLTGGHGNRAAVIHDYLIDQHAVARRTADQVFREALQASGAPGWRTWLMYAGVRVGALFSGKSEPSETAGP